MTAYSQNDDVNTDSIKNTIINDFSKIDQKRLVDLIPYSENGLWGFMDRQTMAVVIFPKYNDLEFFNPDMNGYYKGIDFDISKEGKITIKTNELEDENIMVEEVSADKDFEGISILSSKSGYKGFKTDREGKLIAYADIYHYHTSGFPTWNVSPFKKENRTYAIAVNKATSKYGVIDSLGNALKGFDFNHKKILLNRYSKDKKNMWFFVEGENNLWSLINEKGEYKLRNKIIAYPLTSGTKLGYEVVTSNDFSGVLDLYNMNWVVEPQNKIKIGSIRYSSSVQLDVEDPKEREKATLYYSIYDDQSVYHKDLKGKKYLPQK